MTNLVKAYDKHPQGTLANPSISPVVRTALNRIARNSCDFAEDPVLFRMPTTVGADWYQKYTPCILESNHLTTTTTNSHLRTALTTSN